jgi:Flp pilus assembly protein, pilin Flp
MNKIRHFVRTFIQDESGVTAIEYGVLAVLVVGAIAAAMTSFKDDLRVAFTNIGTKLKTAP